MNAPRLVIGAAALALAAVASAPNASAADRALLIGLDEHADERLNAPAGTPAANDVNGMRILLATKLGFPVDGIKTLQDAQATRANILAAFEDWLVAGTGEGDDAYLYFAGHGYFTEDDGGDETDGLDEGLVPFDGKPSLKDGKLSIDGLVTDDELAVLLRKLKGRNVTIVMDTGFSGQVTRDENAAPVASARAPAIEQKTRAIVVEPKAQAQKSEGSYLDAVPDGVKLAAWSAVSASQAALVDASDPAAAGGVFTRFFIEGLGEGKADKNGNGTVTNAELLAYVTKQSKAYCDEHKAECEMGLTPRLEPALAVAATQPGAPAKTAASGQAASASPNDKLTAQALTDLLANGNTDGIEIAQKPAEIAVGDKDIRYTVTVPHDGFLLLMQLSDDGELVNLFPNQFSRERNLKGRIRGGQPLTVPGDYYPMRFNATKPSAGQIIAIVVRDEIELDKAAGTRAIEVIPREEAEETFLPKIAAALADPPATPDPQVNTKANDWSIASIRYEIKPRP